MRARLTGGCYSLHLWLIAPLALVLFGGWGDAAGVGGALPPLARAPLVLLGVAGALVVRWAQIARVFPAGLCTDGLYRISRHPEYLGYLLYLAGWAGAAGSGGALAITLLLMPALLLVGARRLEYPRLVARYGTPAATWWAQTPLLASPRRWSQALLPPAPPPLYLLVRATIRPILRRWCGLAQPDSGTIPASGPLVVIAPHRSYLDAFLLAATFPRPLVFLATAEAFRPPLQRLFLKGLGCVKLRRFSPDPLALRHSLRLLEAGATVALFPEGERSWDGAPSPVLPGVTRLLALADAPVVAVTLDGSYRLWPRWGLGPRRAFVSVHWRAPRRPSDIPDLNDWLHRQMAHAPGPPTSRRHSAADLGRLLWRCPECGRPDAVRGRRPGTVFCRRCGAGGVLLDGTHLDWQGSGALPLRTWSERIDLQEWERSTLAPPGPETIPHWPFLRLSDGQGDRPLTPRGKGEAVLTPRGLVLRARGWRAYLPAESIRAVMVEGSHKLQVATPRRIYELRYRRGSPRGPCAHLEAWLDERGLSYRRG